MYKNASKVFITRDISSNGLLRIFYRISKDTRICGNIGVKLHSGELGGSHFIKPEIINPLVKQVNGTIIDANTPYAGNRNNNVGHWITLEKHGFTQIAACDLLDEDGDIGISVPNGKYLHANYVGSHLLRYDSIVMLTHFKGHHTCGFGGTLKDYSIGLASLRGKIWIHTAGQSMENVYYPTIQEHFLDAMVDAMLSIQLLQKNIIFITFMNNLSVDGDGSSHPRLPLIKDMGVLASVDPVALDIACLDLLYGLHDEGKKYLLQRIEEKNGIYLITAARERGIGNTNYTLISLDI